MRKDFFEQYTEEQRYRIKCIIIKYVQFIKKQKLDNDYAELENYFLQKVVKPSWFNYTDIRNIRDIYKYMSYIYETWEKQKKYINNIKVPLLFEKDIIDREQQVIVKIMIEEVKDLSFDIKKFPEMYKRSYKGQPIKDMDVKCISKKNYNFIIGFLNEIKKRGIQKKID